MKENLIQIESFEEIRISKINNKFRHVMLKDINNGKSIDYVIFEKEHEFMWEAIANNETKKAAFPGKIIDITLTSDLINRANLQKKVLTFQENDLMTIVVWEWDSWMGNPESVRIEWSLKEQLWKLSGFYNKGKKTTSLNKKTENDYDNHSDYDRDYDFPSAYNNPYYDENLDMDQQSPEFWDNL